METINILRRSLAVISGMLVISIPALVFLLVPGKQVGIDPGFLHYNYPEAFYYWNRIFLVNLVGLLILGWLLGYFRMSLVTALFALPAVAYFKGFNLDTTTQELLIVMGLSGASMVIAASFLGFFSTSEDSLTKGSAGTDGKSTGIDNRAVKPGYSYKDVVGMSELKERLGKAGQEIIRDKGARNGILLYGDPGNGKTFFAEALAGQLNLKFISVSFGDMVSKWVGQTTEQAMKIFDDAEAQAPCVLFIDEIDSVLVNRGAVAQADSETPKTVNAILTRLVNIRGKGVVVVAATNFLEKLDEAAIREGRFDYKIEVPCPDYEARLNLLLRSLKAFPSKDIDTTALERAAKRWEGFSIARLSAIAKEILSMHKQSPIALVDYGVLTTALRNIQSGMGDRIGENVPKLEDLVFEPKMKSRIINIASRMVNIERVEDMGGSVPNGVLFFGPPGTGKTLAAQALAKSTDWAFIKVSGQELLANTNEIDKMYARAKDIRPCIVFIDEADDILADRRMYPGSKQAHNKLLTVMDGAGGKVKDVLFIAATNAPDIIDEAALRGGRFTEKLEFSLPDVEAMKGYLSKWIGETKAKMATDFTAEAAAPLLVGQSLANVQSMLQAAVNESISRMNGNNIEPVTLNDLKAGIAFVQGY